MNELSDEHINDEYFKSSGRKKLEDLIFQKDLSNAVFHHQYFIRVSGKNLTFKKVNFSHSYFENCYFRNINFDSCNFTGCKFVNCNFPKSSFEGCNFEYANFEKTFIDNEILDYNCPSQNNLTLKFARSLRVNFQSIGEAESVNKAIRIELKATKRYLFEAWHSKAAYYRKKYKGWNRVEMFFKWIYFRLQDFIWGNGESAKKLILTGLYFWLVFSCIHVYWFENPNLLSDYWKSFISLPSIFMGVDKPKPYPEFLLTLITILRFIFFALFTSIIIKRYNKR